MKIISFDVGIKNMAYCILSIERGNQLIIEDWNVLNLMDAEPLPSTFKCSCILLNAKTQKKNKKIKKGKTNEIAINPNSINENIPMPNNNVLCGKLAKYSKTNDTAIPEITYYCEKHAKQNTQFCIPKKEYSQSHLNKLKKDELISIYNKLFDTTITNGFTKPVLLEKILKYYEDKCFTSIKTIKGKTASETNLIMIGKNMKTLLNNVPIIQNSIMDITHVIIENQISPIANRMKTIQGMLAQYFIMKCSHDIHIEFVSSINKLKNFVKLVNATGDATLKCNVKNSYNKNKMNSINICSQIIQNNESLIKWITVLNSKKKDDYADSFLQGFWYLTHHNIINYADNLKIYII